MNGRSNQTLNKSITGLTYPQREKEEKITVAPAQARASMSQDPSLRRDDTLLTINL